MVTVHYHLGAFRPVDLDWPQLIPLLGPASVAVARYDGTLCFPALLNIAEGREAF